MPCAEAAASAKDSFHISIHLFMAVGSFNMANMMSSVRGATGWKSRGKIFNTALPSHGKSCGKVWVALAANRSEGPIDKATRA